VVREKKYSIRTNDPSPGFYGSWLVYNRVGMKKGFLILALLCVLAPESIACTVIEPIPMCSIYWDTPLAFLGRVVSTELIHEGPLLNGVSLINFSRALFAVSETYRGEVKNEIHVKTFISSCGREFQVGELYLVFANQDKSGEWQAIGGLGGTHQVRVEAEDDELGWFRSWVKAPAGAVIFGYRFVNSRMPPAEAEVTLAGPVSRTVRFDSGGKFALTGLPPGRYAVSAIPSQGSAAIPPSQTVDVVERGCAQVSFAIR
jgi:hypothetical protein